jgi:hypothetical protein
VRRRSAHDGEHSPARVAVLPLTGPRTETRVREYQRSGAYAQDAANLANAGWQPVNRAEKRDRPHWLASLLLWRKHTLLGTDARTVT